MTTTAEPSATQRDIQRLAGEIGEIKELMRRMTETMSRITVIDERINMMQKFDDRTDRRMDSIENQLRKLHMDYERDKTRVHTTIWLVRALWAAAGAGALAWAVPLLQVAPK